MEQIFNDYFNHSLRSYLKYPETFDIKVFEDRVLLIPNQTSGLLQIIKSNPSVKAQLIKMIQDTLGKYIPDILEVYITTNGTDITFRIAYESPYQLKKIPEIGIYANMASRLDLKSLNDWCRLNTQFNKLCHNNIFWYEVLNTRFPEYTVITKERYNLEKVYKGFLYYEQYQKLIEVENRNLMSSQGDDLDVIGGKRILRIPAFGIEGHLLKKILKNDGEFFKFINKEYPEFLDYVIRHDVIKLSDKQVEYILNSLSDAKLTSYLLNKYQPSAIRLRDIFKNILINNKLEALKVILDYRQSLDPKILESEFPQIYIENYFDDHLDGSYGKDMTIEIFEYMTKDMHLGYDEYLDYLRVTLDENRELIDYLLDKIRPYISQDVTRFDKLISTIINSLIPMGKLNITFYIYELFKSLFTKMHLYNMKDVADEYYDESGDESFHEHFGWNLPEER